MHLPLAFTLSVAAGLAATAATPPRATAPGWPQFRGPNATGVSPDAKPPTRFGPQDHVLWKIEVPWSPSSPAIADGRVLVTTHVDGKLETRSYDASSGKLQWSRGVHPTRLEEYHSTDGSPAASTPAVSSGRVVSYFGSFGLICHDLEGNETWRLELPVASSGGSYGTGTSPMIVGNRVFLNRDQNLQSSVMALDLSTGKKVWETPRPEAGGGFGTPVYWKNDGVDELVVGGSLMVKGYDLSTGNERWRVEGVSSFVCTTPVASEGALYFGAWSPGKADSSFPTDWPAFLKQFDNNHDGKVTPDDFPKPVWDFVRGIDRDRDGNVTEADLEAIKRRSARANNVLIAIRPGGLGDITTSHVAWKFTRGLPYVPSPLLYDGRVYLVKDGGLISSVEATTGKAFYTQERLEAVGSYYASPVAADGRIYLASLPGKVTVVQAGGETPTVLHQADFGERIFATPALVRDTLYLRTQGHLYAFAEGAGK